LNTAKVSNIAHTGDVTDTSGVLKVTKINNVALSGLATGILKNTNSTGVPSIAVAADFPTLNQDTTGDAANVTGTVAVANGGTGQTAALVQGGVIYSASTTAQGSTALGTEGEILQSSGTGTPVWVSGGTMMFAGNTNNVNANTGSTTFYPVMGTISGTAVTTSTSAGTRTLISRAGTITNLYVKSSTNPGSGNSYAITIRKNGSSTTVTATISGGSATSANYTTNSFTVAAGDEIEIQLAPNSSPTPCKISWAVDFTY
jgi:hypothetical protein